MSKALDLLIKNNRLAANAEQASPGIEIGISPKAPNINPASVKAYRGLLESSPGTKSKKV